MKNLRYLVVGCGRSGTGFASGYINATGAHCGHEEIFDVYGANSLTENAYESSWYSAPYIQLLRSDVKVLHVVRNPSDVIKSFHRIGMLSESSWRHVTEGRPIKFIKNAIKHPVSAKQRLAYVKAHKEFLSRHSEILLHADEIKRLEAYWRDWNKMIEEHSTMAKGQYYRVRIEDFWNRSDEINRFLNLRSVQKHEIPKNKKSFFKERRMPSMTLDSSTIDLARYYGYHDY